MTDTVRFRIAGPVIVYGEVDLQGDRFSSDVDLGPPVAWRHLPVLINHGRPVADGIEFTKDRVVAVAELDRRLDGVYATIALDPEDGLHRAIYHLAGKGLVGFSSAAMIVRREGGQIVRWVIYEISLTPSPMSGVHLATTI